MYFVSATPPVKPQPLAGDAFKCASSTTHQSLVNSHKLSPLFATLTHSAPVAPLFATLSSKIEGGGAGGFGTSFKKVRAGNPLFRVREEPNYPAFATTKSNRFTPLFAAGVILSAATEGFGLAGKDLN